LIEKAEDIYNDQWLLIFEAIKRFKIDQQKTPVFLFGRSFGGLIATNMSVGIISESIFTGVALLTPYYRLWTEKLYTLMPVFKLGSYIVPHLVIEPEFKPLTPEIEAKWGHIHHDPRNDHSFTPTTALIWAAEQERAQQSLKQTALPLLVIEAEHDAVVRNDYIQQYFAAAGREVGTQRSQKSRIPNKYVRIHNADHTTVCYDKPAVQTLITEVVAYFNRLIDEKQRGTVLF
jgi:alpha-beta hydrolase superfamily lysophospholipase